jgi:hypothetical protein
MAYDKKKIYQQAEEAIKKNNLFFIEDIVAFLPCDKTTFYRFFPTDCNEYNTLKDLLEDNKIKTKSSIRAKLYKSDKASELLALYRLIATSEEHQKLNQSYIDHTTNGKDINITPTINVYNTNEGLSDEQTE